MNKKINYFKINPEITIITIIILLTLQSFQNFISDLKL